jgi:predicted phosphoribosyltransferase
MRLFADRADAGRQLAARVAEYARQESTVVLALPRGGVPVGFEVAASLAAPLDVYVVRKLGVPGREELAMGALAGDGTCVVDEELVESLGVTPEELSAAVARESAEIARREQAYRDSRPAPALTGKTVIVVDDGLATGATMRAAAIALGRHDPAKLVVAVPVAAPRTCASLAQEVDRVVCAFRPEPFHAVGLYYENFDQIGDDEVRRLLAQAAAIRGQCRTA